MTRYIARNLHVETDFAARMRAERGPKFAAARESLPEALRPTYDLMVASYSFYSLKHHGREWVSYRIIAELVKEGWRPAINPPKK